MAILPVLAKRIGLDTIGKLEAAASRRLAEAGVLHEEGKHVGAVYLYGYVAECRLQAAYFRLIGYGPHTQITRDNRTKAIADARQKKLMSSAPHDIYGWARFLVETRKQRHTGFPREVETELIDRARAIYSCWRPGLRYRVTVPTPDELKRVRSSAEWFEENYRFFGR